MKNSSGCTNINSSGLTVNACNNTTISRCRNVRDSTESTIIYYVFPVISDFQKQTYDLNPEH